MPEVTHRTVIAASIDEVWGFVKDMNNWAPMLTGYQTHQIEDERRSIWTLKGDVGILSRTVRLDVNITEWSGPSRVSFTLKGLNELVEGDGTFEMTPAKAEGALEAAVDAPPERPGLLTRFLRWIARLFFRAKFGAVDRGVVEPNVSKDRAVMTFRLRMEAGGPTGPLVNAMLEPALLPATEDLANRIARHLESSAQQLGERGPVAVLEGASS